jgi:hypothetical protein
MVRQMRVQAVSVVTVERMPVLFVHPEIKSMLPCRFDIQLGVIVHSFLRGSRRCLCGMMVVAEPTLHHRSGVCYAARRGPRAQKSAADLNIELADVGYIDLLDDM